MNWSEGRGSRRHEAAFLGGHAPTWRPKYEKGAVGERGARCLRFRGRRSEQHVSEPVTFGQSLSFTALREIATALQRARRELSNGTLQPPQFPKKSDVRAEPSARGTLT